MGDVKDDALVVDLTSKKNMSMKRKYMKMNRNLQQKMMEEHMCSYMTLLSIYWKLILLSMYCYTNLILLRRS